MERLGKKYNTRRKGLKVVIEELRQRVAAKAAKIRKYKSRIDQLKKNRMSQNNLGRLFEKPKGQEIGSDVIPDATGSIAFWKGIWSKEVHYNEIAEWLKEVEIGQERIEKQQNVSITLELITRQPSKMPNWNAPGPDGLQRFWIKNKTVMDFLSYATADRRFVVEVRLADIKRECVNCLQKDLFASFLYSPIQLLQKHPFEQF